MAVSLLEGSYANARNREKDAAVELYTRAWAKNGYGATPDFAARIMPRIVEHLSLVHPPRGDKAQPSIIDFGCGNGLFLASLLESRAVRAPACGVDVVRPPALLGAGDIQFVTQPMWEPITGRWDFALSTDALEHVPSTLVLEALRVIRSAAPHGFLRISTRRDNAGGTYHLTVRPPEWWVAAVADAGGAPITTYRVECGQAVEIAY